MVSTQVFTSALGSVLFSDKLRIRSVFFKIYCLAFFNKSPKVAPSAASEDCLL
jgi:hypothetical protein